LDKSKLIIHNETNLTDDMILFAIRMTINKAWKNDHELFKWPLESHKPATIERRKNKKSVTYFAYQ